MSQDGVECPDCGQLFVSSSHNSSHHHDDSGVSDFKRPTIISRVVRRILSPFSPPEQSPEDPSRHDHQHHREKSEVSQKFKRHHTEIEREDDGCSEFGYSWFSQFSPSATAWKRARTIESETSHVLSTPGSTKRNIAARHPLYDVSSRSNSNLRSVRRHLEYDDENESVYNVPDRLNLKNYLQPQHSTTDLVQAWVNELQNCDPVNSLLTPDLSCDCKNGVAATKNDLVNDFLVETKETFVRIQKLLEDIKLQSVHSNNYLHTNGVLVAASAQIKTVVTECSKSRLRIQDFLEKRS